jgi:hypothetical protein
MPRSGRQLTDQRSGLRAATGRSYLAQTTGDAQLDGIVAVIAREVLRGYVLEELLARLLKASGYDLLVSPAQDPVALASAGSGLQIRGRGAPHQVDVLGQLRTPIPFSFPVRLFVEAKYRVAKTGLADVRNALGVINDVNEHYSTAGAAAAPTPYVRYHYRYALFSASGFTVPAQEFAITQQISLVDLRSPSFGWLLVAAQRITDALLSLAEATGAETFPVGQVREALRRGLGTWPFDALEPPDGLTVAAERASTTTTEPGEASLPADALATIAAGAGEGLHNVLYVGFTSAPFLLLLQPDEPEEAALLLAEALVGVDVSVAFAGRDETRGEWVVVSGPDTHPVAFRLALPPMLESVVLAGTVEGGQLSQLPWARRRTISVVHEGGLASLRFLPRPRPQSLSDDDDPETSNLALRHQALNTALAFGPAATGESLWSAEAVRALLAMLRAEGRPQASVIEFAAAHGGAILRARVYAIAEYPPERTLRGFTRPVRRLRRRLVEQGALSPDAAEALQTQYAAGVVATHFIVPEEFIEILGENR